MTWPPRRTVIVCAFMSTVLIIDEPMVNEAWSSLATHLSGPVCTPVSGAFTLTLVPGRQYSAGRHMSWRLSSQPHAPVVAGTVFTDTRFSTSALSALVATAESNWMLTGIPTPTAMPALRMP